MNLNTLGWHDFFASHFASFQEQGFVPGRIAQEHRNCYQVLFRDGELRAEVSGKFRHDSQTRADFPAVGDWVALAAKPGQERAIIHAVLPRRSVFSRKAILSGGMPETGGTTDQQVLAANVDTVMLITGLDDNYNVRRIERYVTIAWDSGAAPVIVLNKADLCDDVDARVREVADAAIGVPVHAVSAMENSGLEILQEYIKSGQTVAFLGSSGVGKSTIINHLLGTERQKVQDVRGGDSRGRHTTVHRELIVLPDGGIVIDTPGMREIQPWSNDEGIERTFADIIDLATHCRFNDCSHQNEPGCAIRQALEDGTLDRKRFRNYLKLQKELAHLARRQNEHAARQEQRQWGKRIRNYHKAMKELRKKGLA